MFWLPIFCGGRQATSQARFVWLRFHGTRQDNRVCFAAEGFFRTPFRVQRALFLRAVRPAADTDFTCWHAVSLIYFPPTTDSTYVNLMVFAGGVMERLFVDFFLVFRPEFFTSQTNSRHIVLNVFGRAAVS